MKKLLAGTLLCAASALANAPAQTETFVIHTEGAGHVATIMIPVGAVSNFSADAAEALTGFDPRVEAMRLSGDVRIRVLGQRQPIQITADQVLLELTADDKHGGRSEARGALGTQAGESVVPVGHDGGEIALGQVSFTVETVAGAMQIRADHVEHRFASAAGV